MLPDAVHPAIRYAITDRSQLGTEEPERRAALLAQTARWADTGIDFIQLREKDLPRHELLQLCRELRSILATHGSRTRLLLNSGSDPAGTLEIALTAQLDGLHLTSSWTAQTNTPTELRANFTHLPAAQPATISISCHSIAEVTAAAAAQVDLILFGPIFGKQISGETIHPGVGLETLAAACQAAGPIPVLALGGITHANTASCLAAGAAGIAAIRLFAAP
jgi:thiamine-phosphate pyrophosphorylase